MIYGHGDDLWHYAGKVKHNFSTNIRASFDLSPLMEILCADLATLTSYPEPEPVSVEKAIAEINGIRPEEVMVTNGATESIYLIARTGSGCHSAIIIPTFREYQDGCRMNGHRISFVSTLSEIPADSQMVWLCNPNNPTGTVTDRQRLLRVAARNPHKIFVIDQAYADYTPLQTLSARDALNAGNIILLGSLTKRFAVPGLRIGYSIANATLLSRVKAWRMPWAVNAPAIKCANYLLEHRDAYKIDTLGLHTEALRIARELTGAGIKVWPTDCNFILCELPHGKASDLKDYLMETEGILIRDASNFEGLGEVHFRLAAQSPAENDLIINRIKQWITS